MVSNIHVSMTEDVAIPVINFLNLLNNIKYRLQRVQYDIHILLQQAIHSPRYIFVQ